MKILKIKAYQIFANYRKPMSFNFWDTYPLPPLSTIRGWFHSVIKATKYIPISISVQGDFESIVLDLQTLIKFDRKERMKDKGYPLIEGFNKTFSKSPTYVANVFDVKLVIYIKAQERYLNFFMDNIFKNEYPSLGRREDLLRIDFIDFIVPIEKDFSLEEHVVNYGIYLNRLTADKFNLKGINYRMNFKYDGDLLEKTGLRYFEKKDVVYIDEAILEEGKILFDDEDNRIIDFIGDTV